MSELLQLSPAPELFIGLVAPIGVDLELVTRVLSETLEQMDYQPRHLRLTKLMEDVPVGLPLSASTYVQSYKERIAYANAVRGTLGDHALAALAISAIRAQRALEREDDQYANGTSYQAVSDNSPSSNPAAWLNKQHEEIPLPSRAYIIRQFKRPEEISLMRRVYGRQFILVSAYAPENARTRRLQELEIQSHGGLISPIMAHNLASTLVAQDSNEQFDKHGQNVRDAFPLGDIFIDASSRDTCEATIKRFIHLFFGNNEITPSHDEYGMYMAKSASLRSSDLSRQVGAAVFRATGEIISLGCNEVPKAGGGTYWSGDPGDQRDFVTGRDPNEQRKLELVVDFVDRLSRAGHLSQTLQDIPNVYEIARKLMGDATDAGISESKIMDLIEFGRSIHAEMSAICDAARNGVAVQGAILFTTTFPCHICAKHIVASGISRVVYLEPYPKSYASQLHGDSIEIEGERCSGKVVFQPFTGVSPYRYRDLFEKGRRKYLGAAQRWNAGVRRPMIEVYYPSYFQAELKVVSSIKKQLEALSPVHGIIK